jgi:hypothetical protein
MQAKLTKELALQEIENIKEKIVGENILQVLKSDEVTDAVEKVTPPDFLVAAVMAGYVYYDDEKKCVVQKLVKPLKTGEQSTDTLYYTNSMNMDLLIDENTTNQLAFLRNILTRLTCKSKQLIGKLETQDLFIAKELAGFFYQF